MGLDREIVFVIITRSRGRGFEIVLAVTLNKVFWYAPCYFADASVLSRSKLQGNALTRQRRKACVNSPSLRLSSKSSVDNT